MNRLVRSFDNWIEVPISRFVVDLNRRPGRAIYMKPEEAWGLQVRKQIPNTEEIEQARKYYNEFYQNLEQRFNEMLEKFPHVLVYDFHSFNPRAHRENPDVILGRSNMPPYWQPFVQKLQYHFQNTLGCDKRVVLDSFYPGGYLPRWLHQKFPQKVCCIALEFNKNIFMTTAGGRLISKKFKMIKNAMEASKPIIKEYLDGIS